MSIRLSIVIPVLNSHEIVRRQELYWQRMGLRDDIEIVLVDDGSEPPIDANVRIVRTHDTRPWTWALARNAGAKAANGLYLLMTDIDHIISADALEYARHFAGDKIQFRREFGVLLPDGELTQDVGVLRSWGLLPEYGLKLKPLPNNFVMRRDLFFRMGGYREDLVGRKYPQGEDRAFKRKWHKMVKLGEVTVSEYRPVLYMFPNGQFCGDVDYNPFGLFHRLSRKTNRNYWHKRLQEKCAI